MQNSPHLCSASNASKCLSSVFGQMLSLLSRTDRSTQCSANSWAGWRTSFKIAKKILWNTQQSISEESRSTIFIPHQFPLSNTHTHRSMQTWLRRCFIPHGVWGRDRKRLIKYESEMWKTLQHTALQHAVFLILPYSLSSSLCSSGISKGEWIKPVPHPTSWPACEKQHIWSKIYTCVIRTAMPQSEICHSHTNCVEPQHYTPRANITEMTTKMCMSTPRRSSANRSG